MQITAATMGVTAGLADVLLGASGTAAAASGLYLLSLSVAAWARRPVPPAGHNSKRLAVLVPAHNESDLIGRTIASLRAQDYPVERYEIIVLADNCTDDTAVLARAAGARVLERYAPDARGKGQALRWAMDRVLTDPEPPDAFVVIDADTVADPGLLAALVASLEQGAEAVQAQYLVLDETSGPRVELRAIAFLLFHRVRFAGRAALGLPVSLVGNGMVFTRALIERHAWDAFTGAEDLEYSVNLRLDGVRPVFAENGLLRGPVPESGRAAQVQRERWEGGRVHVVRTALPRVFTEIVLRGRLSLLDLAVDLLVPPLGLLVAGIAAGTPVVLLLSATGLISGWVLVPWLTALLSVAGYVLIGLRAAQAPRWMYARLASAPAFVAQKVLGTAGVLRSRATDQWIRTERPNEIG